MERDAASGSQECEQQEDCCESTANLGVRGRLCLKEGRGKERRERENEGDRQADIETEIKRQRDRDRGGEGGRIRRKEGEKESFDLCLGNIYNPEIFHLFSHLSSLVPCP